MVAVKMLKEDATDDLQSDFEKEASILAEFDHPNIVKLLGVCAVGNPMCLLFEFMAKGDLNTYLRSNSPNGYLTRNGSTASGSQFSGGDLRITNIEQANISKQICNGLVYLSDRKFVHRDLASRNCLLDNPLFRETAFPLETRPIRLDYVLFYPSARLERAISKTNT